MKPKLISTSCSCALLCLCLAASHGEPMSYPWLDAGAYDPSQTIVSRIPAPKGFKRTGVVAKSFQAWLRGLPLTPEGSPVRLYPIEGGKTKDANIHEAVIHMDVLRFQQCADAVIRLRAEYLWSSRMRKAISFRFTNGFACSWEMWAKGWRPRPSAGSKMTWKKVASADDSREAFMEYLDGVMEYAGTISLGRDLAHIVPDQIRIGDVIVQGGSPGHAVLVLDMAENDKREKIMLLGQSFMPSQEFHVLKNPAGPSPWYPVKTKGLLVTPEWVFHMEKDCRRFADVASRTAYPSCTAGFQSGPANPVSSLSETNQMRAGYPAIKEEVKARKVTLGTQFEAAISDKERSKIIAETRKFVFETLTQQMFPAWYGTRWAFNGSTRTPGDGQIACGTFVVYTLQDAGFKIPSKMARQPSENIIKNLIGPSHIMRFSNAAPMERVIERLGSQGDGLFIVGLDIHVGFVIQKGQDLTFCHSNYYDPPRAVVNQNIMERSPLTDSKYRVFGKILDDPMMIKWLKCEPFPVTYDFFRKN